MKNLPKICALAAVACAAWVGWCHMDNPAQDPWVQGMHASSNNPETVDLLFTIESKHGSLVHLKGDQYELALPLKEIKSVLAFSDRPDRIAFKMNPAKFAKLIHSGKNNFDMDPPNLVVSWGDHKYPAAAYQITGHRQMDGYLLYSLTKLNQKKIATRGGPVHQQGKVAVFIDEYEIKKSDCLGTGGTLKECTNS